MGENEPPEDRSDEQLTPKEAYNLTENQGLMGKTVAKMFDVSPSYVSQKKSQYDEAHTDGRESVTPEDFDTEELKSALGDETPDNNPYESTCPRCEEPISKPNGPGIHDCPECGKPVEWYESDFE
jgi:hypothetical protein